MKKVGSPAGAPSLSIRVPFGVFVYRRELRAAEQTLKACAEVKQADRRGGSGGIGLCVQPALSYLSFLSSWLLWQRLNCSSLGWRLEFLLFGANMWRCTAAGGGEEPSGSGRVPLFNRP